MKKILYILLTTVLLTSCEDMFRKMVVYNGDEETPVLCVNAEITVGRPVKVFVTRSWFFLDENRFVGDPRNQITRRGIVGDATVEMQVNGGEWQRLSFVHLPDTTIYSHVTEQASYYTIDYDFRAGDVVTIRAQHPDYETVTATEKVPAKPQAVATLTEQRENVLFFSVSVNPVQAQPNDVIFFYVTGFGHLQNTYYLIREELPEGYLYDTLVTDEQLAFQRLYSEDFMFSEYDLPRTQHGFYTQNGPLYTSAEHFTSGGNVTLLLDCAKFIYNGGISSTDTLGCAIAPDRYSLPNDEFRYFIDSVVITVRLSNESYYMYRTTVMANSGSRSSYAPEISLYSNEGGGEGYGDIFSELADLFSELGVQEGFQAYTNIEGGFGHFSFLNHSSQVLPAYSELDITDDYYYY